MRFILSRKGFDSQFGGTPSPVFKTKGYPLYDYMYSIPIPERDSKGNNFDLKCTPPKTPKNFPVNVRYFHLDPDIRPELHYKLPQNWVPILGQSGADASHLANNNVTIGDIFLFFGLFNDAKWDDNREQWVFKEDKPYHAIWGYMQIAKILKGNKLRNKMNDYNWHPHCRTNYTNSNNTLYIGSTGNLKIENSELDKYSSYGIFKYNDKLRLTKMKPNKSFCRTKWSEDCLPWLDKEERQPHMSYHSPSSFFKEDKFFQAASKGQEFVTDDLELQDGILKKSLEWFGELLKFRVDVFPVSTLQ